MKLKLILAAVIILGAAGFILTTLTKDSKPPKYNIESSMLAIETSFGVTIPLGSLTDLNITDTAPEIGIKTNGLGLGSVYKGEFLLKDGKAARLYIDTKIRSFITFMYKGTIFYINADSVEKTEALFSQIKAAAEK